MYGEDINITIDLYSRAYKETIADFNCGNESINNFLTEKAHDYQKQGKGITRLVIDEYNQNIIGFYTLTASSLLYDVDDIKDRIRGFSAVEIKMFAIDLKYQDIQYGREEDYVLSDSILDLVISDIYNMSETTVGVEYITLYAVPNSVEFYKRNRFRALNEFMKPIYNQYTDGCQPMYLPL